MAPEARLGHPIVKMLSKKKRFWTRVIANKISKTEKLKKAVTMFTPPSFCVTFSIGSATIIGER